MIFQEIRSKILSFSGLTFVITIFVSHWNSTLYKHWKFPQEPPASNIHLLTLLIQRKSIQSCWLCDDILGRSGNTLPPGEPPYKGSSANFVKKNGKQNEYFFACGALDWRANKIHLTRPQDFQQFFSTFNLIAGLVYKDKRAISALTIWTVTRGAKSLKLELSMRPCPAPKRAKNTFLCAAYRMEIIQKIPKCCNFIPPPISEGHGGINFIIPPYLRGMEG